MESFITYLVKSSIILSLFYLVYFFLLRKDTFFTVNRHFLLVGMLSSLLLPFLEFTTIEFIEKPVFKITEYTTIKASGAQNSSVSIDWRLVIFYLYITITLLLLGRFIFQLLSLKKIFTTSQHNQKEEFSFLKTKEDIAPFSFFKYIIFNPILHDTSELEMILKHEKIHAKQYHTLDILLTNVFVIFQWINPFSWLYKKSLQQNLEFIADQEAVRDLPSKKEYQLTLVKVSSSNYSSITNNFYQSLIKKRIVMLNKKESNHRNLWKATIILPLLSLFLWGFNTKTEIQYIQSAPQEVAVTQENEREKPVVQDAKELAFPIKEQHSTPTNESSLVSSKEFPKKSEHQNIKRNTSDTKFPLKSITSLKKNLPKEYKKTFVKKNTIDFTINKNSTKEDIERIKRIFKNEYDVEVTFSDISRNNADEITSISVDLSSKKSNANYAIANETPIYPFVISYDSKNEKISIGQSKNGNHIWVSRNHPEGHSDGQVKDKNVYIVKGDKKHKVKGIAKKDGQTTFIISSTGSNDQSQILTHSIDQETILNFDGNSDKDILFFIDGKKASKKDIKKLKPNQIESVDVSKGESSVKKYGKKAKDGVINIITKKKNK